MKNSKPEEYKREAIRQLESLRDDFKQAAAKVKTKKSFWPRINSKSTRVAALERYADYTQKTIDNLKASKPLEKAVVHPDVAPPPRQFKASGDLATVFAPFDRMTKAVSLNAKYLPWKFSMYRHAAKKDAAVYEALRVKAKAITPKIWQAFGLVP
jgi:hypothetical protein